MRMLRLRMLRLWVLRLRSPPFLRAPSGGLQSRAAASPPSPNLGSATCNLQCPSFHTTRHCFAALQVHAEQRPRHLRRRRFRILPVGGRRVAPLVPNAPLVPGGLFAQMRCLNWLGKCCPWRQMRLWAQVGGAVGCLAWPDVTVWSLDKSCAPMHCSGNLQLQSLAGRPPVHPACSAAWCCRRAQWACTQRTAWRGCRSR